MYTVGQHVLLLDPGHGPSPFIITEVFSDRFVAYRMDEDDEAMVSLDNRRAHFYDRKKWVMRFSLEVE